MFRRRSAKGKNTTHLPTTDPGDRAQDIHTLVDEVNIITKSLTGRKGYIRGETLRPKKDSNRIFLLEDEGSPHRHHYAYKTIGGELHLDSIVSVQDSGHKRSYLRQRTYSQGPDGSLQAVVVDTPFAQAMNIAVDASRLVGCCVRKFTSDGKLDGSTPWPINDWDLGGDPLLDINVLSELTPEDLRVMNIVEDVLTATSKAVASTAGCVALRQIFQGAS